MYTLKLLITRSQASLEGLSLSGCLTYVLSHIKPSPMKSSLQVQMKESTVFSQEAFTSQGSDSQSSIPVLQNKNNNHCGLKSLVVCVR